MHPDDYPSAFVSSGAFCWGNGEFPLRLMARSLNSRGFIEGGDRYIIPVTRLYPKVKI
ncbi:MAG TPA: hypothetical protein V6D26_26075 [Stenomitos sp.]